MREFFEVPDNYFLSHSVGCLPKQTQQALIANYLGPWSAGTNWSEWMPVLDKFRAGLASILGVSADLICPQSNISSALTKVIYSLPQPTTRNKIILSKEDFPTVGFVFKQAERTGYEICFIDGDPTDIENWETTIDETAAIVHITHALSNTSHLLPVQQICDIARAKGAISIVDVAQSLGGVRVDITSWNPDFVTGTGVKFLCFGPGACFLYCSKARLENSAPVDVGWFSHENPFEMDIEHFQYAKDAMRFFGGTPSPAPLIAANAAMDMWQEIGSGGFEVAHKRIETALDFLIGHLNADIMVSPKHADKRGATLVIAPKNRKILRDKIKSNGLLCDERKEGFRFSLHGYTSDEEVKRLSVILKS